MAKVIGTNQIKNNDGSVVAAQNGGWYDGQQFWNGALGAGNTINNPNQVGFGQQVSTEVNSQSAKAQGKSTADFLNYISSVSGQSGQPAGGGTGGGGTGGTPSPGGTGGMNLGATLGSQPQIPDIQGLYDKALPSDEVAKLTQNINDIQAQMDAETANYNQSKQKTGNNPFLSASVLTGQLAAINKTYNDNQQTNVQKIQTAKDQLAQKRADAEQKVNIALKQYDINNQAYQQNMDKVNMFLSTGAIAGASADDIASIASVTGMSFSMVKSLQQKAVTEQTKPQLITSEDDSGNLNIIAVDQNTGKVIGKQMVGGVAKSKGSSAADTKILEAQQTQNNAAYDAKMGATLQQLIKNYVVPGGLTTEEVYQLYNSSGGPRGMAKETLPQAKAGQFANLPGFKPDKSTKL